MSIYKSNVIHKGSSAFTAYTFIYIETHLWVKDMSNLWPLKRKNKVCGFSNLTAISNGFCKSMFSQQYYIFYYHNPILKHFLVTNFDIFEPYLHNITIFNSNKRSGHTCNIKIIAVIMALKSSIKMSAVLSALIVFISQIRLYNTQAVLEVQF